VDQNEQRQDPEKSPSPERAPRERPSAPAVERSEASRGEDPTVSRGRPGRRSVAEKRQAVLSLLSGKASVDQVARQYGVSAETVVGWRDQALVGIEEVLARSDSRTPRERELERENKELREAVARVSVERALAMQAVEEWKRTSRPTRPARSRR